MVRSIAGFHRVSVRQLRLVAAIAEAGSMVRAGEAIGMTQPGVSKAVRDLERDLGVALFERGNRGVTPTSYGEALVRHARRALAQLEHAAQEIDDLAHGAGGRVAVGTLLAASAWLLPRAIDRLRTERPRVIVDVVEGTNDRLQPMLLRGRARHGGGTPERVPPSCRHPPRADLLRRDPASRTARASTRGPGALASRRPPGSRLDSPAARDVPSPSTGEGVLRRQVSILPVAWSSRYRF